MKQHWKLIKNEKPDYGMNVLIETNDGWMHEAFRNIGNRGDFYRSGKFTIDEKQIFAWRPLPADYHGSVPTNSVDVDSAAVQAIEARVRELETFLEQIVTVDPDGKDLWIQTVKIRAAQYLDARKPQ